MSHTVHIDLDQIERARADVVARSAEPISPGGPEPGPEPGPDHQAAWREKLQGWMFWLTADLPEEIKISPTASEWFLDGSSELCARWFGEPPDWDPHDGGPWLVILAALALFAWQNREILMAMAKADAQAESYRPEPAAAPPSSGNFTTEGAPPDG